MLSAAHYGRMAHTLSSLFLGGYGHAQSISQGELHAISTSLHTLSVHTTIFLLHQVCLHALQALNPPTPAWGCMFGAREKRGRTRRFMVRVLPGCTMPSSCRWYALRGDSCTPFHGKLLLVQTIPYTLRSACQCRRVHAERAKGTKRDV